MKILLVSPSFYPATYYGGPIFSTLQLAKALKKQGVDIRVVTTNANGKEKLKIKSGAFHILEENLEVKYCKSLDSRGTSPSLFINLWKEIKKTDVVYLISIFSPPTPVVLFMCSLVRIPVLLSLQGQLGKWCLNSGSKLKKLWLKLFISPFIKNIYWHGTSEDEEQMVKEVYPDAKTFVLPNGIDLEEFASLSLEKDKSFFNKYTGYDCSQKKVIVSMGRLHKVKGFDILILSFAMLQKNVHNTVLLIAGEDFGEKVNLEQIIKEKKLSEQIFLVGKLATMEKLEFLHNADVFALASHHENFGIVYAESLAAGTPIVASKNTPWLDAEKFGFGRCVENTTSKFDMAIEELLNSDVREMGEFSRRYVKDNFNWNMLATLFFNKCSEIANGNDQSI